jgi:hypothetical protein
VGDASARIGVHANPSKVMLPAVRAGAARAGRALDNFSVCMKPLVAAAATEAELAPKIRDTRARIAFYASTPQYRAAFEHLGLADLADRLKLLSRAQRWEEMPQRIATTFCTSSSPSRPGTGLPARSATGSAMS